MVFKRYVRVRAWVRACVCVCVSTCHRTYVEVRGQSAGISSLLPSCGCLDTKPRSVFRLGGKGLHLLSHPPSHIFKTKQSDGETLSISTSLYHLSQNCLMKQPVFTEDYCVLASAPNALDKVPTQTSRQTRRAKSISSPLACLALIDYLTKLSWEGLCGSD